MAKLKWDNHEFISNSFSPQIAVATSNSAESICRRNSLTFIELLTPFCKLNSEVQLKDTNGTSTSIKNLRIQLIDINARPPQSALARKFMNQSVNMGSENIRTIKIGVGNTSDQVEIPMFVPWFDNWRETFFQVQFPSDHEFTRHYLACVFVVSSSESDPLETLNTLIHHLHTLQNSAQAKVPKWFTSNVLKYFVLLHDTHNANYENATKVFETLKQTHGASNCYFLAVNSRPVNDADNIQQCLPDPWAQYLTRRQRKNSTASLSSAPTTPTDSCSGSIGSLAQTTEKLELGQEANEISTTALSGVQFHPLSPENENHTPIADETETIPPLNSNVWRGSPSVNFASGIHGNCLSVNDVENVKSLILEFCTKSLIPYVEKLIQNLTEQISSKKGVSRSLFSATKRWFTPSKPGASGSAAAYNTTMYSNDSTEIQHRRLGDLYFMFGNYAMAFNAYHTVKRDFYTDQAWLYYAGALEMAGLSAFMGGDLHRKWIEYLDESITTYANTCKLPQFATRATLFSTECLKQKKMYGEAANQYIRMTSEDSDLRSALLLEQASYCFLNCTRPRMIRKYAFHIVLAGHRFSKCAQRKHSLRCYRQAFEVYNGKHWSLAEDHIHYTIGRQAAALSLLEEATNSFAKLLRATTRQATHQQAIFLKEYLLAHQSLIEERKKLRRSLNEPDSDSSLPLLPIPRIKPDETKVLLGQQAPLRTPGRIPASSITFTSNFDDPLHARWNKLEQIMFQQLNTAPPLFKPQVTFFTTKSMNTATSNRPLAVIGEPIQISVCLDNTLHIALPIKDLYVLWRFNSENTGGSQVSITNEGLISHQETDAYVKTHVLKQVVLPTANIQDVVLSVTPLAVGDLILEGICYTLQNTIPENVVGQYCVAGKQLLTVKGQRLKDKDGLPQYAPDKKIEIQVTSSAPCLQINFTEVTQELLANEIVHLNVELRNSGSMPLHNILMASTVPHLFSHIADQGVPENFDENNFNWITPSENNIYCNQISLPEHLNNRLEPGQSHTINLWLQAPNNSGRTSLDLLFYYENINTPSVPRYRLVRHQWHFSIQDSLELDMQVQPSFGQNVVETVAMSLTAFNNNQLHHAVVSEISLDHASLISQRWTLINNLNNKSSQTAIKLQSQEKVHILLKAQRTLNNSEKPNYTKELFRSKAIKQRDDREIELTCLDFARKVFCNEGTFNNQSDIMPSTNAPIGDKQKPEALLVVGWQAVITDSAGNRRTAIGQNHLTLNSLSWGSANKNAAFITPKTDSSLEQSIIQPLLGVDNKIPSPQKQVTYNMIHASNVHHDFSKEVVCIIPVTVIINSTVQVPLMVKVNTLGTSTNNELSQMSSSRYELTNPQSLSNFRWIGHSEFRTELPSFTSKQLSLKCAFTAPGTYDLGGRIEILCRALDSPYAAVMQNVTYDSSIVITGHC